MSDSLWPHWIQHARLPCLSLSPGICSNSCSLSSSQVAQKVKNLPEMQETHVWSLDWEGPLEKRMTIHSGILAWKIPWTEEPGRRQSTGSQRVWHNWKTNTFTFMFIELVILSDDLILSITSFSSWPNWGGGWVGWWVVVIVVVFYNQKIFILYRGIGPC